MSSFLIKIKKTALYGLAIIGIIAIIWIGFSAIIVLFTGTIRYSGGGPQSVSVESSLRAPGLPSFELSDLFGREKTAVSPMSKTAQAQEGQLTQRKIIKNGSLSLLIKKAEEVSHSIQSLAKTLGGFVSEARIYEVSSGIKSGTVTIRVPADRFDEAMTEVKNLAVKVESENVSSQDVTEQFIDFEARLRNLQAQEVQYLEILKRANTVEDILKVQQKLGEVRSSIEQIQGQLQFLSRQVDMSTIAVSLTSEADVTVFGIYWKPLFVIKQSFRNMLSGLTGYINAMIGFIFFLPRLILWLATIIFFVILAWRILHWIWTKFFYSRPVG